MGVDDKQNPDPTRTWTEPVPEGAFTPSQFRDKMFARAAQDNDDVNFTTSGGNTRFTIVPTNLDGCIEVAAAEIMLRSGEPDAVDITSQIQQAAEGLLFNPTRPDQHATHLKANRDFSDAVMRAVVAKINASRLAPETNTDIAKREQGVAAAVVHVSPLFTLVPIDGPTPPAWGEKLTSTTFDGLCEEVRRSHKRIFARYNDGTTTLILSQGKFDDAVNRADKRGKLIGFFGVKA